MNNEFFISDNEKISLDQKRRDLALLIQQNLEATHEYIFAIREAKKNNTLIVILN